MPRPTKREQILDAAQRCFYDQGITATGVDAVAAAANVSKRTLYNHFPTKEALVLSYVQRREERWRARLEHRLAEVDDPTQRVLAYFDAYFDLADGEDFRGCAFVNAAAEIADDDSPTLAAIVQSKDRVRADLEQLLEDGGHDAPAETATLLAALLEGGIAVAGVRRDPGDLTVLKAGAAALARSD